MATYVFSVDRVEIHNQKADTNHSDSDWLSFIVTVANPITKNVETFPAGTHHIGSIIHTGDTLTGPFTSNPITVEDSDVVTVNYLITNLGSSKDEDQFAEAVKVTDKAVGVVGPIAGAAIGLFVGDPAAGLKIGQEIAKGFDTLINTLSDIFDFFNIHVGAANCNGEVLHDTLTFQPNELKQAVNRPASREYTGPQENSRCGMPPHSKVTFSIKDMARVSFRSINFSGRFVRHINFLGELTPVINELDKNDGTFDMVPGLADSRFVSLRSVNFPNHFLRHQDFRLKLQERPSPEDRLFNQDATFILQPGLADAMASSFKSLNFPDRFIRHRDFHLFIEPLSSPNIALDATFKIEPGFIPPPPPPK